jgi:hypothetical protein
VRGRRATLVVHAGRARRTRVIDGGLFGFGRRQAVALLPVYVTPASAGCIPCCMFHGAREFRGTAGQSVCSVSTCGSQLRTFGGCMVVSPRTRVLSGIIRPIMLWNTRGGSNRVNRSCRIKSSVHIFSMNPVITF